MIQFYLTRNGYTDSLIQNTDEGLILDSSSLKAVGFKKITDNEKLIVELPFMKLTDSYDGDSSAIGLSQKGAYALYQQIQSAGVTPEGVAEQINTSLGPIRENLVDIDSSIDRLDGSVSGLETSVATIDGSIANIEASVNLNEGAIETLTGRIAEVSSNVIDVSSKVNGLTTRVENISTNLIDVSASVISATSRIADVSNNLIDVSADVIELTTRVANVSTLALSNEASIGEVSTRLNNLTNTVSGIPKFGVSVIDSSNEIDVDDPNDNNKIFLVKDTNARSGNLFTEYIVVYDPDVDSSVVE